MAHLIYFKVKYKNVLCFVQEKGKIIVEQDIKVEYYMLLKRNFYYEVPKSIEDACVDDRTWRAWNVSITEEQWNVLEDNTCISLSYYYYSVSVN